MWGLVYLVNDNLFIVSKLREKCSLYLPIDFEFMLFEIRLFLALFIQNQLALLLQNFTSSSFEDLGGLVPASAMLIMISMNLVLLSVNKLGYLFVYQFSRFFSLIYASQ